MDHSHSPFCFCELAPLYALGVLNEAERTWVETQVEMFPELATELEEYQIAATTLVYSALPIPLNDSLKDRLLQNISDTSALVSSRTEERPISFSTGFVKQASRLRWRSHYAPGLQIATLHIDKVKREMSGLVRAEAQAEYPAHRHGGVEEILMMEGELEMGDRVFHVGDYIRSEPGSVHPLAITPNGCMFFLRMSLDNEVIARSQQ